MVFGHFRSTVRNYSVPAPWAPEEERYMYESCVSTLRESNHSKQWPGRLMIEASPRAT